MGPVLPRFVEPPGSTLAIRPPFPFESVSTRVFPLRASLDSLQRFVDGYLNIIPPELGRFRVNMPYVQLMILDYGKMAIEAGNYGWLAQREILFSVPLEWYVVRDGRWVFKDWASFSPYIYVDDDMSMTVGRQVYGWPKTTAQIVPAPSDWVRNPGAPIKEAVVQTAVFSSLYSDQQLETQPLLEVEREVSASMLQFPFDARATWTPWEAASRLMRSATGFSRDLGGFLSGMGVMPMHPGTSGDNYIAMMTKAAEMGFPFHPNLAAGTLCLKQFRSSEDPDQYCYQAVTNADMRFTRLNAAGVLGEAHLMAGDTSGGYRIHLHQWPSLPIVQTLGIEVERQWRGKGCDIATLAPVFPIWYNVNMVYEAGTNVAWRTRDGLWHDESGRPYPDPARQARPDNRLFNTLLGAANRTIAGAFRFEDTTVRVLPLLARRATLVAYLEENFNPPLSAGDPENGERFTLWGPAAGESDYAHVYLTATSFGTVSSTSDNIGDWADDEMSFLVPVRRERRTADGWEFIGVGVVPAFTFVDNPTAAAANAEVLGIPTSNAEFIVPENNWMTHQGPSREAVQVLLELQAEVMPVVGRGEKSQRRRILTVEAGDVEELGDPVEWRVIADRWGEVLTDELRRKKDLKTSGVLDDARALALEVLGNAEPVSYFTLKQFRDVADPTRACYQSLVRIRRTLREVIDMREIERPLTVRITDYPTLPIVQALGLVGRVVESGGGLTWALQPQRPFWFSGTLEEALGERVATRGGTYTWQFEADAAAYLTDAAPAGVAVVAADTLDGGDARRVAKIAREWGNDLANVPPGREQPITMAKAAEVLATVDPQPVIESILSREWGSWFEDARWRGARRRILAALAGRVAGVSTEFVQDEQDRFFREMIHAAGRRPGEAPVTEARYMNEHLKRFAKCEAAMETAWQALADLVRADERAEGGVVGDLEAILTARQEFLQTVGALESLDVRGRPEAPDLEAGASTTDNHARLHELVNAELGALARAMAIGATLRRTPTSVAAVAAPPSTASEVSREALQAVVTAEMSTFQSGLTGVKPDERQRIAASFVADLVAHREPLREMVRLARARCDLQRSALVNRLARADQKPDFVVWRRSVGTEADRIFPLAQSWDEYWYAGAPADVSASEEGPPSSPSPQQGPVGEQAPA